MKGVMLSNRDKRLLPREVIIAFDNMVQNKEAYEIDGNEMTWEVNHDVFRYIGSIDVDTYNETYGDALCRTSPEEEADQLTFMDLTIFRYTPSFKEIASRIKHKMKKRRDVYVDEFRRETEEARIKPPVSDDEALSMLTERYERVPLEHEKPKAHSSVNDLWKIE